MAVEFDTAGSYDSQSGVGCANHAYSLKAYAFNVHIICGWSTSSIVRHAVSNPEKHYGHKDTKTLKMCEEHLLRVFVSCMFKVRKKMFFFGKALIMLEEKDSVLGLEPVTKFLPSARFKSGNNVVHRHRMLTRLMIPGNSGLILY